MKTRFYQLLVLLLAFAMLFTGCEQKTDKAASVHQERKEAVYELTDDLGRKVKMKIPVSSVVSMAPSHTEILYAIGASEKLKAVTVFCNHPEEAKKLPKIGDFFNPNVELILQMKPQLVLAVKGIQNQVISSLEKAGIAVIVLDATSLEDCASDIETIGKLLGKEREASEVADSIRNAEKRYKATGKKVFIEISPEPLITAGKNTFISDAIRAAGGINAGDEFGEGYPIVNPEKLIQINPDVYLISKSLNIKPEDVMKRPGFQSLKCVKEGKVFVVPDDDIIQRPGPRIVQGIEAMNELINR